MEEAIKNVYIFLAPLLALQGHFEISQVFGTKMYVGLGKSTEGVWGIRMREGPVDLLQG